MELKDRKKRILKIIVDNYIVSGVPIGSKAVVENMDVKLSTATIRNEMAALEEMGYLVQPHVSAGRVPSDLAYRLYVDALMEAQSLSKQEVQTMKSLFDQEVDNVKQVIGDTVKVLSDITNCVAVALLPKCANLQIENVRLVPVTSNKALVVIATNHGVIKDRVVRFPEDMNEGELSAIAALLTERARHMQDISAIHTGQFFPDIEHHQGFVHNLLDVFQECVAEPEEDVILGGTTKLLDFPEYNDMEKVKQLIRSFEDKQLLARMLERDEEGITVTIGSEGDFDATKDCSLVTFHYRLDGLGEGSFGIIGPKRMNYGKVLKILETLGNHINFLDML